MKQMCKKKYRSSRTCRKELSNPRCLTVVCKRGSVKGRQRGFLSEGNEGFEGNTIKKFVTACTGVIYTNINTTI